MLSLKGVTKKFGSIVAVENISFEVEPGEFVYLTGPSGAGKTTLLRLIMRELIPDEGEIILAGKDISTLPSRKIPHLRQNIGFIFQDFKVLSQRTVRENVEIALAVSGRSRDEWNDRVQNVIKMVGLSDRINLFPSQLSGGELQRVSLARALVVNPKIILADEPTGNLDWETAERLMDLLEMINKEGKTVIMATHHQGIVKDRKKREIRIKPGKRTDDKSKDNQESPDKSPDKGEKTEGKTSDQADKSDSEDKQKNKKKKDK